MSAALACASAALAIASISARDASSPFIFQLPAISGRILFPVWLAVGKPPPYHPPLFAATTG
jgi:hypothetical protein